MMFLRRRISNAIAKISAGMVLALGMSLATASPAAAATVHGCPTGYVCIYAQNAGWGNDAPTHMFYYYGYYNLSNQYGTHRVLNNQYDGAEALLCLNYGGSNCTYTLAAGYYIDFNLTPINSVRLQAGTPPPPPPSPVTRYRSVQANDFANVGFGCVRKPWSCDAESILTFQNNDGWVRATRSGSSLQTFSAEGGWQIESDTQLQYASFFLQVWDCTTHTPLAVDVIRNYEQPTNDKSGTLYRASFTVNSSHTYEARFFGDGSLYDHPASHFFGFNTPEQQIMAPELNGVVQPLYVSTGCF
jgi:hypothetical protein